MKNSRLAIFAFIDAFGWEVLRKHAFMEDELVFRKPVKTVFGYSSTCIPTILTGKMPQEHGHFSCFYYNPDQSPFRVCRYLSLLPKGLTSRGRVRRYLSKFIGSWYGFTGYFQIYNMPFRHLPLFDYSEQKDLYQPEGINNGQSTIIDHFRSREIPFHLSDWHASEGHNLKALKADLAQGEIRAAYLYMAHMDAVLHEYGPNAPQVADKVKWYERELREVLREARTNYEDVRLFVFSDHGQVEITEEVPLIDRVEATGLQYGKDYIAVYDSTMARIWCLKHGVRDTLCAALSQEQRGYVVSDEKLAEWGCKFPDGKYGDLFYVMKPGMLLNPSFMGEYRFAGMHGYEPEHCDSTAMLAATHEPMIIPDRLDDHYAMMAAEADWAMRGAIQEPEQDKPSVAAAA